MKLISKSSFVISTVIFCCSCAPYKPFSSVPAKLAEQPQASEYASPDYTLFLIGDAGEPQKEGLSPLFRKLKSALNAADPAKSGIIFLGDNIYPCGMPPSSKPTREDAEWRLRKQFEIFEDFNGKVIFLPGNHDWNEGREGGMGYNLNQEEFTEGINQRGNIYLPDSSCPGPVLVPLSSDAVLQVIDSQWWLHPHQRIMEKSNCEAQNDSAFMQLFRKNCEQNKEKRIIVAAHHPMESNGPHGGKYPFRSHIFPLLEFNPKLWIPLPVLGSIYVLYRKIGNIQDIPHPRYKNLRNGIETSLEHYPGSIYVNGHDHSLQFIEKKQVYYITSGAGTKHSHVVKGKRVRFGYAGTGFAILKIYKDNVLVEFYNSNEQNTKPLYTEKLK